MIHDLETYKKATKQNIVALAEETAHVKDLERSLKVMTIYAIGRFSALIDMTSYAKGNTSILVRTHCICHKSRRSVEQKWPHMLTAMLLLLFKMATYAKALEGDLQTKIDFISDLMPLFGIRTASATAVLAPLQKSSHMLRAMLLLELNNSSF